MKGWRIWTLAGLLVIIGASGVAYLNSAGASPKGFPTRTTPYYELAEVTRYIEEHGVSEGLNPILEKVALSIGTPGLYVADASQRNSFGLPNGSILAAYPKRLVGKLVAGETLGLLRSDKMVGPKAGLSSGILDLVDGGDGRQYAILMVWGSHP